MTISSRVERVGVFLGDIVVFVLSLWCMLVVRYGMSPNSDLFFDHLAPFSVLFVVWLLVYFSAGLYEKQTAITKRKLLPVLLRSQVMNAVIAIIFFYFIPYFGITPKVNLFIYLIISSALIILWRLFTRIIFSSFKKQKALLIGSGKEMEELYQEINANNRYKIRFEAHIDTVNKDEADIKRDVIAIVKQSGITLLVADFRNQKIEHIMPALYELIFSGVTFLEIDSLYEDIFDRVPLSLIDHGWFLEKISTAPTVAYDSIKRLIDVMVALILGVLTSILYIGVAIAIKLDDGGSIFITQQRIGKGGKSIAIVKFRSMKANDHDRWTEAGDERITRVGRFLRKSRIDEFPQFWNVLKGDISLIGPRPDISGLGAKLAQNIPYYTMRTIIQPGLSGWAQIKQDLPPQSVEETKLRLAYDFYYVKNRSLMLDIQIALRTLRTLLSRLGV
jgi:exopolysaccharide biosynthesis polyprenyl glycosylphosphotransferase